MATGKWIGGIIGFINGGVLGSLAGIAIGALFDYLAGSDNKNDANGFDNQPDYDDEQRRYEGQRNSFLFSMLVLASYVIKADGRVMHSEMECIRRFLRDNFGPMAQQQGEDILLKLFREHDIRGRASFANTVADCCRQISDNVDYAQRLQMTDLLVRIAKADGRLDAAEQEAIRQCAAWMFLSKTDVESMLNLGESSLDAAYKVLGVEPTATDAEVQKAYRKLAIQHHPDRVAKLGEDIRRAAEKKMQEINAAKDLVYKARGL